MATVLPLAPMQDQSTNLCSSHSTTSLRQSSCQRDPNACPSTLCIVDRFVFLVCLRAPPFREILSSISCRVVCPFLCSCSCPYPVCFALSFVLFAFALARLAFGFVVRARPSTRLIVLHVFSFLSTTSRHGRKFHTMNKFLGTFDHDCPSPTNPSEPISFTNFVQSVVPAVLMSR